MTKYQQRLQDQPHEAATAVANGVMTVMWDGLRREEFHGTNARSCATHAFYSINYCYYLYRVLRAHAVTMTACRSCCIAML